MRLYIAGGCGEHGRNCFMLDFGDDAVLVDCGLGQDALNPEYPRLTDEQIRKVRCVFLTHSHSDHVDALPWFFSRGGVRRAVASRETFDQLDFDIEEKIPLDALGGRLDRLGLAVEHGRTGHCIGAVWYAFEKDGKRALFSGDYIEETAVYANDPIRGRHADIAVLDCAYGREDVVHTRQCAKLVSLLRDCAQSRRKCFLPVPKYGRSVELLALIKGELPKVRVAAEEGVFKAICEIAQQKEWLKGGTELSGLAEAFDGGSDFDVLLIGDGQLKKQRNRDIADAIIAGGGTGIITGTPDKGSYIERLMDGGLMTRVRYPVHQCMAQFERLMSLNSFDRAIPYHSPELKSEPSFDF